MAALTSPGISITVTDEAQYLPTAVGTVPFVLFASAQDKTVNNNIAPGTKKSNAGKVYGISSQRELIATFGSPNFRVSAAGSPLHGDELNEYGLMAAYSALALGNRVWAIRADIDLDELIGTTVRPVGEVPNGTNWFDLAATQWGLYEYDQANDQFANKAPLILYSLDDVVVDSGIYKPRASVGSIGSYAVVVRDANNYVFYKNSSNEWVQVGSDDWRRSFATVLGTINEVDFSAGGTFTINGREITIPSSEEVTVSDIADLINAEDIEYLTAATEYGFLSIYIANEGGAVSLVEGTNNALESLGIVPGTYHNPTLYYGKYNEIPSWSSFDAIPRPSGSLWVKTSVTGQGTNFVVKQFNSTTKTWAELATPLFADGYEALVGLDSTGGGKNIEAGSFFVKYNTNNDGKLSFKIYNLTMGGSTEVSGSNAAGTFTAGDTFTMLISETGTATPASYNITLSGTSAATFVADILAADIPEVTARANNSGVITIEHRNGGMITLVNTTIGRNPVTTAGFTTSTEGVVPNIVPGAITLTNWALARYTYSSTEPYTAPDDGTLWFYSDPTAIDIMICDIDGWKGYKNVARDVRGYNLQNTDPNGVIVTPTEPTTQSDNSALVPGDLWLDSGDLENYPRLYRYTATGRWQLIDNTDRVSRDSIVFADARWDGASDDTGGVTDPITGDYPNIADMQYSNYIDLDAPDYRLFPRGTLLWNTRRGGYNVKKFVSNYFNAQAYPNEVLPEITDAWISDSGTSDDGTPYCGHHAQRALVVKALKAALDGSLDLREEAYNFNLLACPGYPELVTNLIALNNDRSNTGFIIGDMPMTLQSTITDLRIYNNTKAVNRDPYVALYYPSALTNDLSGNEIAVPASHVMLRTYIRNDNIAYQWFAPAGTRRGLVDNASSIGYVDANSGLFINSGINQQLRDALYEMNINPITLLQGTGLVVYGQKTRNPTTSSMDRVNVARLVNYLRVVLQPIANQFLFEPNDKITRDQVKQACESVMNDLVAKRGIYDYLVVCDTSNNTPDRIARSELYIDIAIEPVRAVEFIYIPIRLKNPGTIQGTA